MRCHRCLMVFGARVFTPAEKAKSTRFGGDTGRRINRVNAVGASRSGPLQRQPSLLQFVGTAVHETILAARVQGPAARAGRCTVSVGVGGGFAAHLLHLRLLVAHDPAVLRLVFGGRRRVGFGLASVEW